MNLIEVNNRKGKLSLNDTVTQSSINRVIEEMQKLYGQKAVAENYQIGEIVCKSDDALEVVNIEIHSPGGSVLDGYRLYHAIGEMKSRGVEVVATVNTLAASMGSVIAMAASKVQIVPGGQMMIHDASMAVYGNAGEHAKAAKILDGVSEEIANIYSKKSGKSVSEVRELMKKETWMSAQDAVSMGFADEVYDPSEDISNKTVDKPVESVSGERMSFLDRLISPSDAESKSRIEALESTIANNDAVIADYEAKIATFEVTLQEAAELKIENINLKAKADLVEGLEERIAELEAFKMEAVDLLDKKEEITQEAIAASAAQLLAAQGHGEPLNLQGEKPTGEIEKIKPRAELKTMKPREIAAFVKDGGKFID
jgi:ATP-dependent protease ClpP protease subunit